MGKKAVVRQCARRCVLPSVSKKSLRRTHRSFVIQVVTEHCPRGPCILRGCHSSAVASMTDAGSRTRRSAPADAPSHARGSAYRTTSQKQHVLPAEHETVPERVRPKPLREGVRPLGQEDHRPDRVDRPAGQHPPEASRRQSAEGHRCPEQPDPAEHDVEGRRGGAGHEGRRATARLRPPQPPPPRRPVPSGWHADQSRDGPRHARPLARGRGARSRRQIARRTTRRARPGTLWAACG